MAAYAAVTSLLHLLDQIQLYHARRPIFLDEQLRELASLGKKVNALRSYLESFHSGSGQDAESMEIRIADASYEAEDIIESHLVDDIQDQFSRRLEKVNVEMDSIEKEVMEIREKSTGNDQQPQFVSPFSSSRPSPSGNDTMVGFQDELNRIIDKLTRQQRERQIISITGMGGIGKTTLAKNIYDNPSIKKHFDVCGWVTISQDYNAREMLLRLLCDMKPLSDENKLESLDYRQIGLDIHKYLSQRRYLIVLDDMWSIDAWEKIQIYLPDNNNGSRIMVTSRLQDVASNFETPNHFKMKLLDENESWSLLCKKVFVQGSCPLELEEIGKRIAGNCKGLPLTIVIIGGLLAKTGMVLQDWKDISEDISQFVKSQDDDHCFRILSLSYNHLPIYLKPCFIYMGVFPEDHKIRVSKIIKLWVAEGFLKPISGKILEEVAEDYLRDLIDRNLIFVDEFGLTGKVKFCKLHDLLRDLCLRESWKCRFFCLVKEQSSDVLRDISYQRRVAISGGSWDKEFPPELLHALQSASFLRSCLCDWKSNHIPFKQLPLSELSDLMKLLRVLDVCHANDIENILQLINARYLNVSGSFGFYLFLNILYGESPSTSDDNAAQHRHLFWNIQTLVQNTFSSKYIASPMIWGMPQLRHIMVGKFRLSDPPSQVGSEDIVVLENLQTLGLVDNFSCSEEVLKRMPNIKILKIVVGDTQDDDVLRASLHSFNNLVRLHKLQSLRLTFAFDNISEMNRSSLFTDFFQNVKFPASLKKLSLQYCDIKWDDLGTLIGGVPQLECLKLYMNSSGEQWNPVEGQFDSLKVLEIRNDSLVKWDADSFHFPCLEHLVLHDANELEEIPPGIGEIETLRSIQVRGGSDSLAASAKNILEEQQELGNEDFRLQLTTYSDDSDEDEL